MKASLIFALLAAIMPVAPAASVSESGKSPAVIPDAASKDNPLSFAGGRIVLSMENQTRFEYRENTFDFNNAVDSINDDCFLLNRFRAGLLLKPADWLSFYFQGQDSREIDSNRPNIPGQLGAEGDNPFDLRQAYVEIGDGKSFPLSLKAGRQVLLYGDQRLVGPLEWSSLSRTFDAVKLRWHGTDGLWVDAFVSSVVVPDRNAFDQSDRDSMFSGIYAHIPNTGVQDTEIYALYLSDDDRSDDFLTLGTHWKSIPGRLGPWDYESEFAFQSGEAGGRDLEAFATYVEAGYTFDTSWKPRIGVEYSFGSGDGNPADGNVRSFQNLFPTNHPHYGFMDLFSWSNVHDVALHFSAKPSPKLTAGMDVHAFWLADTADAWRRANARTEVRPASTGAGSFAGTELDCLLTWAPCANFTLTAGYSHFFGGQYLDDTGAGSDANFAYIMTGLKF